MCLHPDSNLLITCGQNYTACAKYVHVNPSGYIQNVIRICTLTLFNDSCSEDSICIYWCDQDRCNYSTKLEKNYSILYILIFFNFFLK